MIMKLSRQEDALNEATQGLPKGRLAGAEALVRARGAATHVKDLQMRRLALLRYAGCERTKVKAQRAVRGSFSGIVLS